MYTMYQKFWYNLTHVQIGPANIKIKLGIPYPVGSHKKTSLPQYIAFNAFVLELKLSGA